MSLTRFLCRLDFVRSSLETTETMASVDSQRQQNEFENLNGDDFLPAERGNVKRAIRLTPEGFVFLIILAFVAFGAVLRNVNLLIVLAGMMFSALILNWRLAMLKLRTVSGHRVLPPRVYSGKLFSIVWKLRNDSLQRIMSTIVEDRLDVCSPVVADEELRRRNYFVRLRQRISDAINNRRRIVLNQVRLSVPQISPQNEESSVFHCLLSERGKYSLGPAKISTTFPFGLIEVELQMNNRQTLYAAPAIGKLVPNWEKHAAAMTIGEDAVKRKRGVSEDEFFAMRKWRSGDSRRNIHWRTTAKMQQPMVRQFDEPSNRDSAIVIDLFQQETRSEATVNGDDQALGEQQQQQQAQLAETILSFASTIAAEPQVDFDGQISIAVSGQRNDIFRNLQRRNYNANLIRSLATAKCSNDPDLYSAIRIVGQSVSSGTPIFIVSTRAKPLWIEQLDAVPKSAYHKTMNPLFETLAYPDMQLGQLTEQIRWIDANSDDFRSLFSLIPASDQARIERFEQRWG